MHDTNESELYDSDQSEMYDFKNSFASNGPFSTSVCLQNGDSISVLLALQYCDKD